MELPHKMREVADLVDAHRMRRHAADYRDREETKKTRDMLKKAGLPL